MHGKFDGGLGLGELIGKPFAPAGFPAVLAARIEFARRQKRDFSELLLAEPQNVALIRPLPGGFLFFAFRRPLQRFSSVPSSSCAAPRPRRRPSASRRFPSLSSRSWSRTPCAPGAARRGSWWSPRAARGSSRPGP